MTGFTPIEIALGRYFVYGIVSSLIFLKAILQGTFRYPKPIWIKALYFSLFSTIGYYTCVVLALRYSSPAVCALILGVSPIAIAFYGNWRQKETSFRSLIIPSILILVGLVVINVPHLETSASPSCYALGLLFSFFALSAWSWYVVANSRFLKHHPEVRSSDWSTLVGVVTLFWVAFFALILTVFFPNQMHLKKYFIINDELTRFFIGSAILGLLCSWVGTILWNKASLCLPVSLAGQLTIFETVFGVLFVYTLSQSVPSLMETMGIVILMSAVIYGISQFAKKKSYLGQITPH